MALSRQELASQIHAGIRDGSLPNNGKLPPEREIAALFNTSRGTVREALIILETLGFIEIKGKEGIFVRTLSEDECNQSLELYSAWPTEMLPHTFQVRLLLESEAAGLAALNRREEDLQRLKLCLERLEQIRREAPPDWSFKGSRVNELFHKQIIEATHNPVLVRMYEGLLRIINKAYAAFGRDEMVTPLEQWKVRVIDEHRIIMNVIESRDDQAARDIMRNHLKITFDKLDSLYKERISGVLRNMQASANNE